MALKVIKPKGKKYNDAEFEKALEAMREHNDSIIMNQSAIAMMAYYCSPEQLTELKKAFKHYYSAAEIDKFYLYGMYLIMGDDDLIVGMNKHLVVGKNKGISAKEWERLDLNSKKILNDPNAKVPIAKEGKKPVYKKVNELDESEFSQLISKGRKGRILTAKEQQENIKGPVHVREHTRGKAKKPENFTKYEESMRLRITKEGLITETASGQKQLISMRKIVNLIKNHLKNRGYRITRVIRDTVTKESIEDEMKVTVAKATLKEN